MSPFALTLLALAALCGQTPPPAAAFFAHRGGTVVEVHANSTASLYLEQCHGWRAIILESDPVRCTELTHARPHTTVVCGDVSRTAHLLVDTLGVRRVDLLTVALRDGAAHITPLLLALDAIDVLQVEMSSDEEVVRALATRAGLRASHFAQWELGFALFYRE
ncbi:MAG: hypothetical protein Q7V62_01765 [Actinomycetota bacterium]|nr:hypothetical protein [Actinomycetota bacterium]